MMAKNGSRSSFTLLFEIISRRSFGQCSRSRGTLGAKECANSHFTRPKTITIFHPWPSAQVAPVTPVSSTPRFFSSSSTIDDGNAPCVSLKFRHNGSVAILTVNNPRRKNALTYSMMEQLDGHVGTLAKWSRYGIGGVSGVPLGENVIVETDEAINTDDIGGGNFKSTSTENNNARVLILTGFGGNFCSGLDLHDHEQNSTSESNGTNPLKEGQNMTKHMARLTNHIHSFPVLSISAIDGFAVGGGAELTTCTDLVVLSSSAFVRFVHAKRGASLGWGGGRRLVKKVGRRRALRMLLLGEGVSGLEEGRCYFNRVDESNEKKKGSGGDTRGTRGFVGGTSDMYADAIANEGETALEATMRLIVQPLLDLPCSQAVRAIKSAVSAADGDEDVMDPVDGILKLDSNKALKGEMDSFLSVWGRESNQEQIRKAKERLKDKKRKNSKSS